MQAAIFVSIFLEESTLVNQNSTLLESQLSRIESLEILYSITLTLVLSNPSVGPVWSRMDLLLYYPCFTTASTAACFSARFTSYK